MNHPLRTAPARHLSLRAETAAELMAPDPVSLREDASLEEAVSFFSDRRYSAAPVIDEAGRPVGVLSLSDLLVHARESARSPFAPAGAGEGGGVRACDLMTPDVLAVSPATPAGEVVANLLALRVHHLFVVDGDGSLVGVISTRDVLRHLRP